jgi:26S proteasome regulatory subunit N7
VEVHPIIAANRYLGPHVSYIIREYRVTAYTQFLDAYKRSVCPSLLLSSSRFSSVMLSSMAQQFGIETSLLDRELSRFIASGRLNAKIDKVGDIIETCRPDKKNRQYQDVIKKGDALLNQIQKLARVIQM